MNKFVNAESEAVEKYQAALRSKLPVHDCPETLSACKARIQEIEKTRRTELIVGKYSYAMASILLFAILAAAYVNRSAAGMDRSVLSRTLSASASGSSMSNGVDSETVEWLRRQLNVNPDAIRPESLQLKAMQRLYVDGKTLGRMVYTDGVTDYVLVIAPGIEQCDGQPIAGYEGVKSLSVNGVNVITWCDKGTSFALAAPKPVETLISLIQ